MPRCYRSPMGTYWRSLHRVERRAASVRYMPRCPHCRRLLREAVRLTNALYFRATTLPVNGFVPSWGDRGPQTEAEYIA